VTGTQELISYRYRTHLVVVLVVGATSSKKPSKESVVSNRIGMKFGRNVL